MSLYGAQFCVSLLLLTNDATQPPRLLSEYFSGVLVACCFLHGSWHRVANVACSSSICFGLGTAFLLLCLIVNSCAGIWFCYWNEESSKLSYYVFFGCNCNFFAFPKVLFLASSSFIPDIGINIQLFVKVGDLFSLSKAKQHLFSSECVLFLIYWWFLTKNTLKYDCNTRFFLNTLVLRVKRRWSVSNPNNFA